jgi:molybdopterin molybdotransferase
MKNKHDTFASVDHALGEILASVSDLGSEMIPLLEAPGRVLYDDLSSDLNMPPFDNSAMDGYAVQYRDTRGAAPDHPVEISIAGEIQAGDNPRKYEMAQKKCIRIMTGAPIPAGADAVIPVEDTREDAARGAIAVLKEMKSDENIRFAGEDIKKGQVVLRKGLRMTSADVGFLAALNKSSVPVYKKPRVAIISTGDEIAEPGEELKPGQIRNTNAYSLYSEVIKYNGFPCYLGIARDSMESIQRTFSRALEHDIVLSTGGVSMGKYDLVKEVLVELGVNISIEKIKMKPGKPLIFGTRGSTLIFGLPGNPVSTLVSFIEFVRPALLKMSGAVKLNKPMLGAIADNRIPKKPGRREFLRGYFSVIDGILHVATTGPQGSGILRSMSDANCLIVMAEESDGCQPGDRVMIQLIQHEEIN